MTERSHRVGGSLRGPGAGSLPQIWPSLYEVNNVEEISGGGHRFSWLYNMIGTPIKGTTETVNYEDRKLIFDKATGDVEGTFKWTFAGENGTTEVNLRCRVRGKGLPSRAGPPVLRAAE